MKILQNLTLLIGFLMGNWVVAQSDITIHVKGNCGMCKDRIESAAYNVIGVSEANWVEETQKLSLKVEEGLFLEEDIHKAMTDVGHDTDQMRSSDEVYENLHGCCKYERSEASVVKTMGVSGVCGMCKERIETAALSLEGVNSAEWSVALQSLKVGTDPGFELQHLHRKLADIGHDTDQIKADDKVYENLHSCCLYRDPQIRANHGLGLDDAHSDHKEDEGNYERINEEVGDSPNDPAALLNDFINSHEHKENEKWIHGMVYENLTTDHPQPLIGANISWVGTQEGTVTDIDGFFELKPITASSELVISYVGYEPDTINMAGQSIVAVALQVSNIIDNVTVTYKRKTTEISFLDPIKVQTIGQKELCKAACCSLSESFETNPAVDVSFTDAITGTRKIEMLGLAGPYVQVMRENMPYIRGIASVYGFEFTPGPWIESIQLNMGAGSVVNGPESMTGQINVELKKPETSEKLFVNLFANDASRLEANVNSAVRLNDHWTTGIILHGSTRNSRLDRNGDGFYDSPLGDQLYAVNRWRYNGDNGLRVQFGLKGTYVDKNSGMVDAMENGQLWRAPIRTDRWEGWAKIGKVYEDAPYKSIGLQLSGSTHSQDARFGNRAYTADQNTWYANLIYQTIIVDTEKKLKLGGSFLYDQVNELLAGNVYDRTERTAGAYVELNQDLSDETTMVLGLRGDYSNIYGFYATPRLHLRYSPQENTAWRLAIGRGQRTASIFAENIGLLASNRVIVIQENQGSEHLPYGLNQEIAYNIGLNYTKEIILNKRSMVVGLDYYYTTFDQQIVVDYDMNPKEVHFYNLEGASYAHSIQAQMDYELFEGVDVRVAYRFNDVKTEYQQGVRQKQLTPKHRAFVNTAITLGKGWEIDGTLTWQGSQRIPDTEGSPMEFRLPGKSPDFFLTNLHLTKNIGKTLSLYVGAENVFNYRQDNPIVNVENPFNDYFDSSMIWGPIMGRNTYIGLRYTIQ